MEVTYIDHMGSDLRVVNSARVSFAKESEWELKAYGKLDPYGDLDVDSYGEEKVLSETDQKLIKYLAKHNHWTPFSHVQITLREKVPIFVARQRFKHMVGFTYNEVSRRYVDLPPEFFTPKEWRGRPENAKQGSSDKVITLLDHNFDRGLKVGGPSSVKKDYKEFLEYAERLYTVMIGNGVSPEQARMVLPQSMMTEYYVTGSLAAWARAYKLRSDPHAQLEIQELAQKWDEIISGIKELEHSWTALKE